MVEGECVIIVKKSAVEPGDIDIPEFAAAFHGSEKDLHLRSKLFRALLDRFKQMGKNFFWEDLDILCEHAECKLGHKMGNSSSIKALTP